ncbi:MAG: MFS transporter [Bradyrhizobium sp.]|nr:MFS transporter [Bradyrhizobium sp.]MDE2470406.1 MFS transporter [Bradyrhizobium sp.]
MNFFISDVQEGFGAFVAFYLADQKWSQGSIGEMLTIGRVASALSLIPGGALTDVVRSKRALIAVGIIMIAGAALILALRPTVLFVVVAEILHGATAGVMTPAIAAISLGIVGRRAMSCRIGRNHRFDAAGNALTAAAMGALGSYLGKSTIFLAAAALTVPALVALSFVRKEEIDYDRARNAGKDREGRPTLQGLAALVKNRQLLWFTCGAVLFQLSNASMLALAVEGIGRSRSVQSSLMASAMIVAPQAVVALLAPWIGYFSELWGRKPLLLVSFAVQIIRAIFFGFVSNTAPLIAVQLLDGISGAIRSVLTTVIIADVTTGTGRFNLASGAVGLLVAVAASVSTIAFGFISQLLGHWAAFGSMAAAAATGGLLVWFLLNETKPAQYID